MHAFLEYFDRLSAFCPSLLALSFILCANFSFTAIHIWEEWKGERWPLYRVFEAVVGCRLPIWLGFFLFVPGLAFLQWLLGLIAYTGWLPGADVDLGWAIFALGAILGGASAIVSSHTGPSTFSGIDQIQDCAPPRCM